MPVRNASQPPRAPDGHFTRTSSRIMTPPPASSEPASLTTEEVAEIRNSHTQIIVLMNQLLEKNGSQPSFPASHAASSAAGQTAASFVPTIMAVGTYGASSAIPLPLHSRFPDADTSVLVVIITHNFKAADLHKLDPTNRDRETTYTFNGLTNQFKISNWAAKEYKTPFLVLIPLQSYFQILMFHVNDCAATESFWAYIEQLLELVAEYKWSVVYAYHLVFFNCCRTEMVARDYSQWGRQDSDLLSKHVYAH
ncbi:hypothetical protein C0989_010085 [Termitomyces sp. Mn162]|nr:hypothetical protein C0989_010085 [Termitomyces sp. Mn162]